VFEIQLYNKQLEELIILFPTRKYIIPYLWAVRMNVYLYIDMVLI